MWLEKLDACPFLISTAFLIWNILEVGMLLDMRRGASAFFHMGHSHGKGFLCTNKHAWSSKLRYPNLVLQLNLHIIVICKWGVNSLRFFLSRSNQGVRINPDGSSRTGGAVKLDFSSLAILSPFAGGTTPLGQVVFLICPLMDHIWHILGDVYRIYRVSKN